MKNKKLLILSNYALPFQVGGSEVVIQAIGKGLVSDYCWDVTIGASNVPKDTKLDGVRIKKSPSAKSSLIRFCNRENPDAIFVYSDAYLNWRDILMFSSTLPGQLFLSPVGFNHTLKNNFLQKLLRKNENELEIICHSKNYIDYDYSMNYISKTHIVPNGVDMSEFNIDYGGIVDDLRHNYKNVLLTVANFFPGKGYDGLLRTYDELYKIRKDFCAVIVASKVSWSVANNWLARMKKIFQSRPYKVRFLLNKDRKDVVQAFLGSDLFVFPSQKEVAPIVLLESMAAGLPWLSMPVGNTKDLCGGVILEGVTRKSDGHCAYTESTVRSMAFKIDELLNNKELLLSLSADGISKIEKDLNWGKICQSYDRVFSGVI
jgi:glycosyltransferase involved in cell wall biosynthesis